MTIRDYHARTKHSVASVQSDRHYLDWDNQPRPFKIYTGLDPIPLPRDFTGAGMPALEALARSGAGELGAPDVRQLARLLHFSAGVTRRKEYPGRQVMHFRAAACTGALYHIDLYLVCGDLDGVAAGVYHFDPHDVALRRLRAGDFRAALVAASGGAPHLAAAPAVLVCTSTFWRNAWKYQARAYRHCFWDSGTLLANLLAVAAADGVAAQVVLGFADAAVNHLLGLDTQREVALALVALGRDASPPAAAPPVTPLALETLPLSAHEVDHPLIHAAHQATSLADAVAVAAWRRGAAADSPAPDAGAGGPPALPGEIELQPSSHPAADAVDAVILRRGSSRRFSRAPMSFEALSTMLRAATRGVPMDIGVSLAEPYLIVNAVAGLAPGAYAFEVARGVLVPLQTGDCRRAAGFLDLGQELAADAAVNIYLLADLDRALALCGERGYRAAQLEAAIVGGKLYLAAYALGLGATGLTFFDDDVIEFFSPHAAGKDVMFLLAAGHPNRSGNR
jgi:SagB-type dehydrogenase family enzyme